ncbi:MAG: hypothetical protein U1E70_22645, partial [Acetobacteraceae bacterium]
ITTDNADITLNGTNSVITSNSTLIDATLTGIGAAGALRILGGRIFARTNVFNNAGLLQAANGGTIDLSGGALGGLLSGTLGVGAYDIGTNAILQLASVQAITTDNANIILRGPGSAIKAGTTLIESSLTNIGTAGTLRILDSRTYTTGNAIDESGTLVVDNDATMTVGGLTIEPTGTVFVGADSALNVGSPILSFGTLINAGSITAGAGTAVAFGTNTNRLILGPTGLFSGTVVGGGVNSILELSSGAGPGTLTSLGTSFVNFGSVVIGAGANWTVNTSSIAAGQTINATKGTFNFTGGAGNDVVTVSGTSISGDTLVGGGGVNTLNLTPAGSFNLGGVKQFSQINLAPGDNTVTVTDNTLSGGPVTILAPPTGNTTINAAGAVASTGKTLTYTAPVANTGTSIFTGGSENDVVNLGTGAVTKSTLIGGAGSNTLNLSNVGTFTLAGVKQFGAIYLQAGNNTVTVTNNTLSGGTVAMRAGATGSNVIDASGANASGGRTLVYVAARITDTLKGPDIFTGGAEDDVISATASRGERFGPGWRRRQQHAEPHVRRAFLSVGGVKQFNLIILADGNNAVTVTNNTPSGEL